MFLRAVREAIRTAQNLSASQPCEIVYAGTGPFAPLAIPLMPRLDPGEVRFTLIDIHEESVESVRTLLDHFGLAEYVRTIACVDAVTYRHGRAIDIVIAEVMQRALQSEPQVHIVRNLSSQLSAGGVVVPQRVTVDLVVAPSECAYDRAPATAGSLMHVVGTVADVTAASCVCATESRLMPRTLVMPYMHEGTRAMYFTEIAAFGPHVLRAFDSGLTWPEMASDLLTWYEGERIELSYELGTRPRIHWERREPAAA